MDRNQLIALSDEARRAVRAKISWTATWIPRDPLEKNALDQTRATVDAQRTIIEGDVARNLGAFTDNYRALRQGKLDKSGIPDYLKNKLIYRAATDQARRTGFGNCAEMARAAYEYVKRKHRKDLDFALLRGLELPSTRRQRKDLTRWDVLWKSEDRINWADFIDIDADCISCTHVFLVLGVCWPGTGTATDMKYGEVPQQRWNARGPVVICDPWMRDPIDVLGTGTGRTVDLSSTADYTSYFDSLIEWSVRKGRPLSPAAQQQGLEPELEGVMKKSYVKIRLGVESNNNSATKT